MNFAVTGPDGGLALREANHRFLNTLTALGGFLHNDFHDFADPEVRDAVQVFFSRIQAFAGVHRTLDLVPGETLGDILMDAPSHLAKLCAELCAAHLAPRGIHCEFRADAGLLSRETCQTLSLIIVELVTNAAKHAFVGRASGRISVSLQRTGTAWVCQVADNGSGLGGRPPEGLGGGLGSHTGGDGMKLVRRLAAGLGAALRVESDPGGVVVSLTLPTEPVAELRTPPSGSVPRAGQGDCPPGEARRHAGSPPR
ncbi:MAG: hypothetical protein JWP35_1139 [Caulobacter sp.]|nr:hypothetical protein [Caulobacter sp.]